MNCCDDYGKCTQGHGCPVRETTIKTILVPGVGWPKYREGVFWGRLLKEKNAQVTEKTASGRRKQERYQELSYERMAKWMSGKYAMTLSTIAKERNEKEKTSAWLLKDAYKAGLVYREVVTGIPSPYFLYWGVL